MIQCDAPRLVLPRAFSPRTQFRGEGQDPVLPWAPAFAGVSDRTKFKLRLMKHLESRQMQEGAHKAVAAVFVHHNSRAPSGRRRGLEFA